MKVHFGTHLPSKCSCIGSVLPFLLHLYLFTIKITRSSKTTLFRQHSIRIRLLNVSEERVYGVKCNDFFNTGVGSGNESPEGNQNNNKILDGSGTVPRFVWIVEGDVIDDSRTEEAEHGKADGTY